MNWTSFLLTALVFQAVVKGIVCACHMRCCSVPTIHFVSVAPVLLMTTDVVPESLRPIFQTCIVVRSKRPFFSSLTIQLGQHKGEVRHKSTKCVSQTEEEFSPVTFVGSCSPQIASAAFADIENLLGGIKGPI